MVNIIIQGIAGRMGHVLCDMIAQRTDCRVLAGIDQAWQRTFSLGHLFY